MHVIKRGKEKERVGRQKRGEVEKGNCIDGERREWQNGRRREEKWGRCRV